MDGMDGVDGRTAPRPWSRLFCAAVVFLLALVPLPVRGAEAIRSFHGDIEVRGDGTMAVTETTTATGEGREIRRGGRMVRTMVQGRKCNGAECPR